MGKEICSDQLVRIWLLKKKVRSSNEHGWSTVIQIQNTEVSKQKNLTWKEYEWWDQKLKSC
jgi:hypothetical protein